MTAFQVDEALSIRDDIETLRIAKEAKAGTPPPGLRYATTADVTDWAADDEVAA